MKLIRLPALYGSICLLLTGYYAEGQQQEKKGEALAGIQQAAWLSGTWEQQTAAGSILETWVQTNAQTFSGKSYQVKGSDTLVFETIQLRQEQDQLLYIPVVVRQNGGQPVVFRLKSSSARELVFENPEHDFPQQISYRLITGDSLQAEISGTLKGKQRARKFYFHRK